MPFGTAGHREWFRQKPLLERMSLVVAWYGQRCGRRAAASFLAHRYVPAACYSAVSVILNPSYLAGRVRKALSR
jgi:hypothetical protein